MLPPAKRPALFVLIIVSLIYLSSCTTNRTPETFLLPANYSGFCYIVYDQPDGQEKILEQDRRVFNIPSTGVLFTRSQPDRGSIQYINGELDQRFYFVSGIGKRQPIKVLDKRDIQGEGSGGYYSKDSVAAFFISAGMIGDDGKEYTMDQYYVGTFNDLRNTKSFTFQHIDSLRNCCR